MEASASPSWWNSGPQGRLSPWSQALLWALIKVNDELELEMEDSKIATFITKVGGGHPLKNAVKEWRHVFVKDSNWYPGKTNDLKRKQPGPKKLLDGRKQHCIATCAMRLKKQKVEPSAALIKEICPVATLNPNTGEAFTDKYILEVFKKRCFDEGSDVPWSQEHPLQKTALPDFLVKWRAKWASDMLLKDPHPPGWYLRHCVWVDPCHNILSTNRRQIFDIERANHGKRPRWMSKDKKLYARNMRASPYGGKQKQFGDRKVWWFVVLSRGRVHIEVMGDGWEQNSQGMSQFVDRVPSVLRIMCGAGETMPHVIASDRGPGFYQSSTGHICKDYAEALKKHHLRPFATEDASHQPPDIPDVLPHETAVAWIRAYLKKHPFSRSGSLDAQEAALRRLLAECTEHINTNHEVKRLCQCFPTRLQKLVDSGGHRLKT